MILASLDATSLRIPFTRAFRHAAANRLATQTIWVVARGQHGCIGFGEGCPREYVTGESCASARTFVAARAKGLRTSIRDMASLSAWVDAHACEIDRNPSAWAAVELALLDLIGRTEGRALESLLGLPPITGTFRYTAVLGDATPGNFDAQLGAYLRTGFREFKVKLCGDRARDQAKARALAAAGIAPQAVRADANNLWRDADAAIIYLEALQFPFWALEEPLPAGDYDGMRRVSAALDARIILDESLSRAAQLDAVARDAWRWIVNLRISKMGGLLRSLRVAAKAQRSGIGLIVGAHVGETSILTRAALALAGDFGDIIVAREGAFGTHLLERDVIDPPLMFGHGGLLDATALGIGAAAGLGLDVVAAAARAGY